MDLVFKVLGALKEPVEYMGVRMFVAFAFATGVIVLLYLSASEKNVSLSENVQMALVAVTGAVLLGAFAARTYTDVLGKARSGDQPDEPRGDPRGDE